MPRPVKSEWLYPVITGLLYGLSFPPFNFGFLSWIALVPLLCFLSTHRSPRRKFVGGFLSGVLANLIIFFWFWKTFHAAGVQFSITLMAWVALASLLGLYFGGFSYVFTKLPTRFRPWTAAATWVSFEFIRTHALTGFPWALFGHTQVNFIPLIQMASWIGVSGISFVLILFNVGVSQIIQRRYEFLSILGVISLVLGLGAIQSTRKFTTEEMTFRVALLQGNIDQYQKWSVEYENNIKVQYHKLAMDAAKSSPDLIVWPESAVPGWIPTDMPLLEWLQAVVKETKTYNLVGAVSKQGEKDLNSVFLLDPTGAIIGKYSKQHLVPFGEYIPFGGFLIAWIPYLGQLGIFDTEPSPSSFAIPKAILAPTICYEAIFPDLIRKSFEPKINFLVNVTNDGWFLDSGAPEQHFVANLFRALETNRPFIRCANTGISAVVDNHGRQLVRSALLTEGVYTATLEFEEWPPISLYQIGGHWFDGVCLMFLIFWIIFHFVYSKHVART